MHVTNNFLALRVKSHGNIRLLFVKLIETTKAHYHVKLHQILTSSYQATGKFLSRSKVKGRMSPKFNHFSGLL